MAVHGISRSLHLLLILNLLASIAVSTPNIARRDPRSIRPIHRRQTNVFNEAENEAAAQSQFGKDPYIICPGDLPTPNVPGFTGQSLPANVYDFANTTLQLCSSAWGIQSTNAGCLCPGPAPASVACHTAIPDVITQNVTNFCQGQVGQTPPACRCATAVEAERIRLGLEDHAAVRRRNVTDGRRPINPFNVSAAGNAEPVFVPATNFGAGPREDLGPNPGGH